MKISCVLIIDDDKISNILTKSILNDFNLTDEVQITKNGLDALYFLKSYYKKQNKYPELILLDLDMPVMDGFEFLNKYNALAGVDRNNKNIVILTVSTNPNDCYKAVKSGIDHFFQKPFTSDILAKFLE